MNIDAWYAWFNSMHERVQGVDPIFSDRKYFALQMSNICENPGFPGLTKVVTRYPKYDISYQYDYHVVSSEGKKDSN